MAMAANIGVAISFWQVILFLSLGKALKAMWSLLLASQFIVYISQWQIKYSTNLRVILKELRRISFGEFLDDFDFTTKVTSFFGIESDKGDEVQEKVGEARQGGESFGQSFGSTLIIASIVFTLVIVIILLLTVFRKKLRCSEKNKERINKIKRKIFWNSLLRYLVLNGLKFFLAAFLVIRNSPDEKAAINKAITMLVFLCLAPLVISFVLFWKTDDLDKKECKDQIGVVYQGKNVFLLHNHRAWIIPLAFFGRRLVFSIASVFLFDHPILQLIVHIILTLGTISYLAYDHERFEPRSLGTLEIMTEYLLLFVGVMML